MTEPYYEDGGVSIWHGDCREVLAGMPEASFDSCICDPPYEIGFMGKAWDSSGVAFSPETWKAVYRVLKPGAFLLAFGGTRTYHRMVCAIEDAGFEIRDSMMWLFASGMPKSLDIAKALDRCAGASRPGESVPATDSAKLWDGYGTGLKPAYEVIAVAMKPCEGSFVKNALSYGVAGLNVKASLIGSDLITCAAKPPERCFAGTAERDSSGSHKWNGCAESTHRGRWPSNVLLSHAPGCRMVGTRKVQSTPAHDTKRSATADISGTQYCGGYSGQSEVTVGYGDADGMETVENWECMDDCPVRMLDGQSGEHTGGASRFYFCGKSSASERGTGNTHKTVKPLDLMRYLAKLACPPTGGRLLDPFMGSGSTLLASRKIFTECVGIELEEDHCAIARKRLAQGIFQLEAE